MLGEVVYAGGELIAAIFLIEIASIYIPNAHPYSHRQIQLSPSFKEASFSTEKGC